MIREKEIRRASSEEVRERGRGGLVIVLDHLQRKEGGLYSMEKMMSVF